MLKPNKRDFMLSIRALNFFEIAQVSGGGNAAVIGLAAISAASNISATCDFDSNSSSRSGVPFR